MRFEALDAPWFWWTGLQATGVRSLDYVPLFPWFGPVLLGIAACAAVRADRAVVAAGGLAGARARAAMLALAGAAQPGGLPAAPAGLIALVWMVVQLRG